MSSFRNKILLIMGIANDKESMYKDGDIPRKDLDILFGPRSGHAYYTSSQEGVCSSCKKPTSLWYVTIKSSGKFLCKECNESKNYF